MAVITRFVYFRQKVLEGGAWLGFEEYRDVCFR